MPDMFASLYSYINVEIIFNDHSYERWLYDRRLKSFIITVTRRSRRNDDRHQNAQSAGGGVLAVNVL